MSLRFEIIETVEEFLKLKDAWNELVDKSDSRYAFMRHEWFKHWMIDFDRTDGIKIVTAYSDNQLSAIAPLRITKGKLQFFPYNELSFMSSSISPRCNFILNDTVDSDSFFEFIFKRVKGWDLFVTTDIEEDSQTTKKYIDFISKNYSGKFTKDYSRISPYKVLDTDWDTYFNNLSKSYRRNIRQAYRNAERLGKLEIEKIFTYDKLEPIIDQIFAVSGRSWKTKDGTDLVSRKNIAAFYKNFSKETSDKNMWEILTVKIDGEYIAFDYCLSYNNRITGLRSDFDENYRRIMPGHIVYAENIKELINRDEVWEFDLGGNLTANKLGWADQLRKNLVIVVAHPGFYSSFLMLAKKLSRYLKSMKKK